MDLMQLKKQYDLYIASLKKRGDATVTFKPPCCGSELESLAPPSGEMWDTLSVCPHCGTTYIKISAEGRVWGVMLDGSNKQDTEG